MPKIEITFDKGLARDFPLKGLETVYDKRGKPENHLTSTVFSGISPLPLPGYAVPGYTAVNIDSVHAAAITTKVTAMTVATESLAYLIGGAQIYRLTTTAFTTITANAPATPTWPHAITNAVETDGDIHDIIGTQQNISGNQVNVLLYSYNRANGVGYLGRYDITNISNWGAGNSSDTYGELSTNDVEDDDGSFSVPRPMVLGLNKMLYIGSGYVVDARDMTSASIDAPLVDKNVLDIDRDMEIQSLAFWGGQLVVAARAKRGTGTAKGRVAVYFWDTVSPSYSEVIYIEDDTCGSLFVSGDELYLFTANAVFGNLRKFDGEDFIIEQEINKQIPLHGGVDALRNGLIWGDSTGNAWYYGEIVPNMGKWCWNFTKVGTNLTCVKRLASTGEKIHFAGEDTGSGEFIRSLTTVFRTSEVLIPVSALPLRSTIKRVEARFYPLETGATASIFLHTNNIFNGDSLGTISYTGDGNISSKVFKSRIKNVNFLTLGITWGTANKAVKLERIIIEYDVPATKQ